MDGLGREDLLRMVEGLTEAVEANPGDTEALAARGLVYSELGDHRRAGEGHHANVRGVPPVHGGPVFRACP